MKLRIKFFGGIYSLVECEPSDTAPFGVVFVCEEPPKGRLAFEPGYYLEHLNADLFFNTTAYCGEPWQPDAVDAAHGMCEADDDIEILEFEGWEYPTDAVF